MRVKIEDYRGWEIMFDTDDETFYTESNKWDTSKTKNIYSSVKKYIDDFIKDNTKFVPFYVQKHYNGDPKLIIGTRKDGDFLYKDKNGSVNKIGRHEESEYYKVNSDNESIYSELRILDEKFEELRLKQKELNSKLIKVKLKDIRNESIEF